MRVGVVGAGGLGYHHIRILRELQGPAFAGFYDARADRAEQVARELGVTAHRSLESLLDGVDAVTIVVPTPAHFEVARKVLGRGIHALIEKPIATTLDEADEMLALARANGALVQTGHVERFNRAIRAALPFVDAPRFIESDRLAPFNPRGADVAVVLDLMIHDIDLILSVVTSEVEGVEAVGVPVLTPKIDIANARLRFANGCIANLTASRISRDAVRKIRFFQRDAYVSIDTAAREVEMYRVEPRDGGPAKIGGGKLAVPGDEPLKGELEDFVRAVRERRPPAVSGEQGRAALALAVRIVELMAEQ